MGRVAHGGFRQPARRCLPPQHTECRHTADAPAAMSDTYLRRTADFSNVYITPLHKHTTPPPHPIHIHVQVCLPPSCYTILSRSSMNHTPIQ